MTVALGCIQSQVRKLAPAIHNDNGPLSSPLVHPGGTTVTLGAGDGYVSTYSIAPGAKQWTEHRLEAHTDVVRVWI